jgi:hypothetical protein
MNVRQTAEEHARKATTGDMQGAAADFTPEALQEFMALGIRPPRGANRFEIVSERREGDRYIYDIKYSNETESTVIRSHWAQVGDEWKLVKAERGG